MKSAASTRSADTAARADHHKNYEALKTVGYRRITMKHHVNKRLRWVIQLQSVIGECFEWTLNFIGTSQKAILCKKRKLSITAANLTNLCKYTYIGHIFTVS